MSEMPIEVILWTYITFYVGSAIANNVEILVVVAVSKVWIFECFYTPIN